jgi:early secretory antigenic target protein ESAT-6
MADEDLSVDFVRMRAASDHIAGAVKELDNQLGQLERDAAPLVATWAGEARQAYEVRQSQWREAAGELKTMLHDIKIALDESAIDFRNTEDRNTRLFTT